MSFETDYEIFKRRLSAASKIRGAFTELAKITGFDSSTFGKINKGVGNPTIKVLITTDKALNEIESMASFDQDEEAA